MVREKLQEEIREAEEAELEIKRMEMDARIRTLRLKKQFSSVDARQKEMYEKELALIANLEKLEKAEAGEGASPVAESSVGVAAEKDVQSRASVADAEAQTEGSGSVVWQGGVDLVMQWNPGVVAGRSEVSEESVVPFSPSERFPESRLASEEIAAFNDFTAKMFPLPGLLDSDVVS